MGNNNGAINNRQRPQMNVSSVEAGGKIKFAGILTTFHFHFHVRKRLLKSKILTTKSLSGDPVKWNLDIYFAKYENMTAICINIQLIDSPTDKLPAKISFEIKNPLGIYASKIELMDQTFTKNRDGCHFRKFIKRGTITDLFGTLITIECSILHPNESVIGVPDCRILRNMENMFEKSLLADCRITAGNKEFKVNKCILACQSPVFRAMFEHEMVENKNDIVKIDDIQSEVVEQMLRYIYTETAPKLKEMARELLAAADKYQLDRLKTFCELSLINSIDNENVCELLVLADLHLAKQLRTWAVNYIQMQTKEVIQTDGWKMLKANYGKLFAELLEMMVASK